MNDTTTPDQQQRKQDNHHHHHHHHKNNCNTTEKTGNKKMKTNSNINSSSNSNSNSNSIRNSHTTKKTNYIKLSHQLSCGLRHKAVEWDWPITSDGYVPIDTILQTHQPVSFQQYTVQDIVHVVQTNDKQRYTIQELSVSKFDPISVSSRTNTTTITITGKDDSNNTNGTKDNNTTTSTADTILCIRANQGHSMSCIDTNELLQRLSDEELVHQYPIMVHGTTYTAWECILQTGYISRMQRNHIHFAIGLPNYNNNNNKTKNDDDTTTNVISGMRKSCEVYIYMNIPQCIADHIPIYKSNNNVLLMEGLCSKDDNDVNSINTGRIPIDPYVLHVVDAKSGNILYTPPSKNHLIKGR